MLQVTTPENTDLTKGCVDNIAIRTNQFNTLSEIYDFLLYKNRIDLFQV